MRCVRADFVGYLLDGWPLMSILNTQATKIFEIVLMERLISVLVCFSAAQAVERKWLWNVSVAQDTDRPSDRA